MTDQREDVVETVTNRYRDAGIRLGPPGSGADIVMLPGAYHLFLEGGKGVGKAFQDGLCFEGKISIKELTKRRIKGRLFDKPQKLDSDQNEKKVAEHYNFGNPYYRRVLDRRWRLYSCARYDLGARTIEEAQECKLDTMLRKQNPAADDTVLDIGCGFGGVLLYYNERRRTRGTGITLSQEQWVGACEQNEGRSNEFRVQHYRDVEGDFDHLASVGMYEHVRQRDARGYFEKCKSVLKPGGDFLLHAIFGTFEGGMDPWTEENIFQGSELQTRRQVEEAFRGLFVPMDWHKIGRSYDLTLMAWNRNLKAAWADLLAEGYSERALRTQDYFQQDQAARFEIGIITVLQIHLFHEEVTGYVPVR